MKKKRKVVSQQQKQTAINILLVDDQIYEYIELMDCLRDMSKVPGFRNPLIPHQQIINVLSGFNDQMFPIE